ncbi:MAG: hypothetical protein II274_05280 [Alistipes sp.]|nr:hypothetical protein [Alistipes sp.]
MGFRLIRIGNKSVGEIKALSFRRSLKNSAVILYVIALWAIYIVVRLAGYDISSWTDFIFSILNFALVGVIDKQLPSRRYKNLGLLLGIMGTMFVFFLSKKIFSGTLSMDVDVWLFGGLILISYGFSIYCLWRWMRNIMWYKDLILQRELRARRRRRTY